MLFHRYSHTQYALVLVWFRFGSGSGSGLVLVLLPVWFWFGSGHFLTSEDGVPREGGLTPEGGAGQYQSLVGCKRLSVLAHFRRARGIKEGGERGEGERFRVRNLAGRLVYARRTCRVKNLESEARKTR